MSNRIKELTDTELMRKATSIFAERPTENVSNKYQFFSTMSVLNLLKENHYKVN